MTTNTITARTPNAIPTDISFEAMVKRAGSNLARPRIVFDGSVFDGTKAFAKDPFASIEAFTKSIHEQYEVVERIQVFDGFTPDEARVALSAVLNRSVEGIPHPVSNDPTVTPSTLIVDTGYDWATGKMNTLIVPAGEMSLPGFSKVPGQKWQPTMRILVRGGVPCLVASIMRHDEDAVEGLFGFVRDWMNKNSIYAGQVVDVNFNFLNLTDFKPENVALTREVTNAIDWFILSPLRYWSANDERGMPRKTGMFLFGPPGGGKTMIKTTGEYLAARLGAVVVEIDPSLGIEGFEAANVRSMALLENGYKVLIAMEDMEKLAIRDRAKVLDILDGTSSKGHRRITIGTTNFLETIDRAMLRPGRFDCVLESALPDLQAFTHLIKVLLRDEDIGEIDYEVAFPHFEGYSYAFIANAVQTIIRAAISTAKGDLTELSISTENLIDAARSVRGHFDLMQQEVEVELPQLDTIFKQLIAEQVEGELQQYGALTEDPTDYGYISEKIREITDEVVEGRINGASLQNEAGDTKYNLYTN